MLLSAVLNLCFLLSSSGNDGSSSDLQAAKAALKSRRVIFKEKRDKINFLVLLKKYAEQDGPEITPSPFLSHQEAQKFVKQRFSDAGIDLDDEALDSLPSWNDIVQNIGETPRIYGLEQCERYRSLVPAVERFVAPTGTFNTGTNLAMELLSENCQIPERVEYYGSNANDTLKKWHMKASTAHGILWQVPWGKHTPGWKRLNRTAPTFENRSKESVLPIVTIRNPYTWMTSMCHNSYSAMWPHSKDACPNLVKNSFHNPISVRTKFETYDSLAHFWNDWYRFYWKKADFPFLMVRLEDLIFHAENVTTEMCKCAGGVIRTDRPFSHVVQSSKPSHVKRNLTDMVGAWIKYGRTLPIKNGFNNPDYIASRMFLDGELMQTFGYKHPRSL